MTNTEMTAPEIGLTVAEAVAGLRAVAARHPDTEHATEAVAALLLRLDTQLAEVRLRAALGKPGCEVAEAAGKRGERHRVTIRR